MGITKARAFANGAVALICWDVDGKVDGCLGFEITRHYKDAAQPDRILASWVPFQNQSNPDWLPLDTSVWPAQRLMWRDLTLRQKREEAALNPLGTTVYYSVRPVGAATGKGPAVPPPAQKSYQGDPLPLEYLGDPVTTNQVSLTTKQGDYVQCAFTNGILSTQFLVRAFEKAGVPLDPDHLKAAMKDRSGAIRPYLAGDALTVINDFFTAGDAFHQALYELEDEELIELIKGLGNKDQLILSNTSNGAKSPPPDDWDAENRPVRDKLPGSGVQLTSRFFNNDERIGHNKYSIRITGGQAAAILTGSTNWTTTGLCAQSNNVLVVESPELADQYLSYWKGLKSDTAGFTPPAQVGAATKNVQGQALRTQNHTAPPAVRLGDGTMAQAWFSPCTLETLKPPASKETEPPPDLKDVFDRMSGAKHLILFAVFLPSQGAKGDVVRQALDLGAKKHDLLVYGSLSDPSAMPNFKRPGPPGTPDTRTAEEKAPHIFDSPEGNVHLVRASALDVKDVVGNFEAEMLKSSPSAHAIVHDKIVVVDPLDENGFVVTGSHNLGAKASYQNDENLLILWNNRSLALAYAVHLMDLWDHYRFRAMQAIRGPGQAYTGFLDRTDHWMDEWLASDRRSLVEYFLR